MENRIFNIGDCVVHNTNSNVIMFIIKFNWDRKFYERDERSGYEESIIKNTDPSNPSLRNKKRLRYKCEWITKNGKVKRKWFRENAICLNRGL